MLSGSNDVPPTATLGGPGASSAPIPYITPTTTGQKTLLIAPVKTSSNPRSARMPPTMFFPLYRYLKNGLTSIFPPWNIRGSSQGNQVGERW